MPPVKRDFKRKRIFFIAEVSCKKKCEDTKVKLLKKVASWLSKNASQKLCSFDLEYIRERLKALRRERWEAAPKPPQEIFSVFHLLFFDFTVTVKQLTNYTITRIQYTTIHYTRIPKKDVYV